MHHPPIMGGCQLISDLPHRFAGLGWLCYGLILSKVPWLKEIPQAFGPKATGLWQPTKKHYNSTGTQLITTATSVKHLRTTERPQDKLTNSMT